MTFRALAFDQSASVFCLTDTECAQVILARGRAGVPSLEPMKVVYSYLGGTQDDLSRTILSSDEEWSAIMRRDTSCDEAAEALIPRLRFLSWASEPDKSMSGELPCFRLRPQEIGVVDE